MEIGGCQQFHDVSVFQNKYQSSQFLTILTFYGLELKRSQWFDYVKLKFGSSVYCTLHHAAIFIIIRKFCAL